MNKYIYKPYHPIFKVLFENEKKRILKASSVDLIIEHVGSTAIKNLGGKGIIDVAIACDKNNLQKVKSVLENLGYKFNTNFSTETRYFFKQDLNDSLEDKRTYHIHLTTPNSLEWNELITFRDTLRNNPDLVAEYANLKKEAAESSNEDGKLYRKTKEPFFKKVLSKD